MDDVSLAQPRRRDRAVEDPTWIVAMLHRGAFCTLAAECDGQPYLATQHFVFDEARGVIYVHSAPVGRMRSTIEQNPRVCLAVAEIGRQLPARTAFGMSSEYASVVVFGRAAVVTDDAEATRALELLLRKYFAHLDNGTDYRAIRPEEVALTTVFRIEIDEWSGKQKQAAADFPGAFRYGSRRDGAAEEVDPTSAE